MIVKMKSYRTTKGKLYNLVKPMGNTEFSGMINPIIADNRNIEIDQAKKEVFLQSKEVIAFLTKIGLDTVGYGKLLVFDALRTKKETVQLRLPYLSTKEFRATINPIISENRDMKPIKAKFRR